MTTIHQDKNPWMDLKCEGSKTRVYVHAVNPGVHMSNKVVSLLYKIDMDPCNFNKTPPFPPPLITPIFKFSCDDRLYPSGMACVNYGSKLYFMGGSLSYTLYLMALSNYGPISGPMIKPFEANLSCFPPDVFVFDCNTCELQSFHPSMNSGKSKDPVAFVVNNQIFVLSSVKGPAGMKHFETINPLSWYEWQVLREPPDPFFDDNAFVQGSAVVDGRLLVTLSSHIGFGNFHLLCYHIEFNNWTSHKSSYLPQLYMDSIFVRDTLYSAVSHPVHQAKPSPSPISFQPLLCFGPIESPRTIDMDALLKVLHDHTSMDPLDMDPPMFYEYCGHSTRRLINLGGHLKGTDSDSSSIYLGFVELFQSLAYADLGYYFCELRFVAFESLKGNSHPQEGHSDSARTIYACRFYTELDGCVVNAACAISEPDLCN